MGIFASSILVTCPNHGFIQISKYKENGDLSQARGVKSLPVRPGQRWRSGRRSAAARARQRQDSEGDGMDIDAHANNETYNWPAALRSINAVFVAACSRA